jgi:hypothetical protein
MFSNTPVSSQRANVGPSHLPRLTAAQEKSRTASELMLTEAIMDLDGETAGPMLGRLLAHRFGAQAAESIGDRIAREAHLCARGQ